MGGSLSLTPEPGGTTPREAAAPHAELEERVRSGANWYYWIAGLSIVNTALSLTGTDWRFFLGLGLTQIVDALASQAGMGGKATMIFVDALFVGVFALFGFKANQKQTWAFVTGIVVYILDGLIMLGLEDWKGAAFHVFVLYFLFKGLLANRELRKLTAVEPPVPGLAPGSR